MIFLVILERISAALPFENPSSPVPGGRLREAESPGANQRVPLL